MYKILVKLGVENINVKITIGRTDFYMSYETSFFGGLGAHFSTCFVQFFVIFLKSATRMPTAGAYQPFVILAPRINDNSLSALATYDR